MNADKKIFMAIHQGETLYDSDVVLETDSNSALNKFWKYYTKEYSDWPEIKDLNMVMDEYKKTITVDCLDTEDGKKKHFVIKVIELASKIHPTKVTPLSNFL